MKRILCTLVLGACITLCYAQEQDSTAADTLKKEKKVSIEVTVGSKDKDQDKKSSSGKFTAGLTFARIDLGLSRYLDKGSFTLSPQNNFLEFENIKTHNVGFEFFQFGYRFTQNFKTYLGIGVDWNHIRLKRNITFQPDQPVLTYTEEQTDFKKNRFSSTYLRVPLSFELRTNSDNKGNHFYLVVGPEVGFLINGKQKQISAERGKVKVRDDFNFNPFRYGAFARVGYKDFGIYAKYYANDVFAENQGPADFKNVSLGVTFGF
ncbi:outer membrane beta-barrel protein [Rubrolithibacter danxiaensis]|uniref:outer membrane beta-barrel protein n=1 Tax=Rubrolithibacter danxiaensis TaxID=3390805 RepID=UPI003BF82C39